MLASRVFMVKAVSDADYFNLALCQMTKRACHDQEGYASDFLYIYPSQSFK